MKRKSKSKQNKQQLLASLMNQGIRKGFLQSETILGQLNGYNLSEEEKEEVLIEFEQAGISIVFPEMESLDTVYGIDNKEPYLDEIKQDFSDAHKEPKNEESVIPDPHHLYWDEISKYPTLSHRETLQLVRQIMNGDAEAKERLIVCNLKFAAKMAEKYIYTGIPSLDLIQQANLGLIEAVSHYKPNRGTQFTSYANFWIKRSILRYIDTQIRMIKLPANISADLTKIRKIRTSFYSEHLRVPTDAEIAAIGGFSIARVKYLQALDYSVISTDLQPTEDMEGTILDTLSTEHTGQDTFADIKNSDRVKTIYSFLDKLSERERTVLVLRFGLDSSPLTLEEIGSRMNLTREGVRKIEVRAIAKLRNMPDIDGLRDYL